MKLNEIKERRGALVAEMRSVLESAGDKGLTADQETSYQNMEKEFSRLSDEVKREEALAQKEAEMKAVTTAPISAVAPGTNPDEEPRNLRPTQRESYARAFGNYIRKRGGREVHNAMSEGTDANGGYLVPEEWADYITTKGAEANVIRRYATVVQTANDRNFPIQTVRAAFDWIAEAGAYSSVNPTLANEELKAYKLGGVIQVSEELLQDEVFDLPTFLQNQAVLEFAKQEEAAFITGDGSGKPLGIEDVTSVGGVSTSGVSLSAAASITANELIDIYHNIDVAYRSNATWVTSDSMAILIRKLTDTDGQYVWQPGLQADQPDRLLGRPFEVSDSYTAVATGVRSIVFADLSYYVIADRLGASVKRLDELYAANGQVGFRFEKRVDGRMTLANAITYGTQA